jgi:hypothetical protein
VEESLVPGESVSVVAHSGGVAPNLLLRWRRPMAEEGAMAVGSNEPVVAASEVRKLVDRVRGLESFSDNGSCHSVAEIRDFAAALDLVPCFTPVRNPESNGMGEAFVRTLRRDHAGLTPLPDAATVLGLDAGWIEATDTAHPHPALQTRSRPASSSPRSTPSRTVRRNRGHFRAPVPRPRDGAPLGLAYGLTQAAVQGTRGPQKPRSCRSPAMLLPPPTVERR